MKLTRIALPCALALLLTSIAASGQVVGLTIDPQSPCAGKAATLQVTGQGGCNGSLDFGDGTPGATFTNLPFSVQHTYAAPGTYNAAVNTATCRSAGLTVVVQACRPTAGVAPDRTIRGKRVAAALPQIEGIFTFGIEPGAALLISGRLFGTDPGRVRILGSNGERVLEVESWSPEAIAGRAPQDIAAICPNGNVIVESAQGIASKAWRTQVPQEVKALPATDVTVVSCGSDGNDNICNSAGESGALCAHVFFPPWFVGLDREGQLLGPQNPAAIGVHSNCWGAVGDDSGTDTYRITLKNGWVLDNAQFFSHVPAGEGHTVPTSGTLPAGFVAGATTWQPSIQWSVTPADAVIYNLYVNIRGPACTSHK